MGRYADSDYVAYERIDKRENLGMTDADGVTMLFMLNDNYANGQARSIRRAFPATACANNFPDIGNAYLYNYSTYGGGFYKYASELSTVVVPPGGYFAFSWKNPDPSDLWQNAGGKPVTILQNGQPVGTMSYERKDGRDGDKGFNPYGVPDANTTDLKYTYTVPRVTDGTNLSFFARTDASAENILLNLDGGIDLNGGAGNSDPGLRDHPPGVTTDVFMGYEQTLYVDRQGPEKFAAINTARCTFGSAGAETYTGGAPTVERLGSKPAERRCGRFCLPRPDGRVRRLGRAASGHAVCGQRFHRRDLGQDQLRRGRLPDVCLLHDATAATRRARAASALGTTQTAEMRYQAPNTAAARQLVDRTATLTKPAGTFKYKIGVFKDRPEQSLPGRCG